jgi:hypothetical protein
VNRCDACRENLAAYLYDDLEDDARGALERHLAGCAACREEQRGLQRTLLRLRTDAAFPSEAQVDWEAFSRSTVQRATGYKASRKHAPAPETAPRIPWWSLLRTTPGWTGAAAGLLVMLGAGLMYGLMGGAAVPRDPGTGSVPVIIGTIAEQAPARLPRPMLANIEESSARTSTQKYLSESRGLLMSLLSTTESCGKGMVDIKDDRARALELLRRQKFLEDDLQRLPLARAQDICHDLEGLLLEVASLNDCAPASHLGEIRSLVDERSLLLRLELVRDELKRGSAIDA